MAALLACWSAWFWDQPCPSEIINLGAALPQTISGPFLKRLCRVCLPGDQADGNCNEVLNLFVLRAKDAAAREEDEEPEDEEEPWLIRWWLLFRESPGLARVDIV